MFTTDTWLKIFCSMIVNSVVFGVGAVLVLSIEPLRENVKYLLPAVVVLAFVVSPLISLWIAPRMRIRNWGIAGWRRGDMISG